MTDKLTYKYNKEQIMAQIKRKISYYNIEYRFENQTVANHCRYVGKSTFSFDQFGFGG